MPSIDTLEVTSVIDTGSGFPIGVRTHERPPRFLSTPVVLMLESVAGDVYTGPVAETVWRQVDVPGGMMGPQGQMEIVILAALSPAAAANRTIRVRFGTLTLWAHAPGATSALVRCNLHISAAGMGALRYQSATFGQSIGPISSTLTLTNGNLDHSQNQPLQISVQADGAGDTITMVSARVVIYPSL